MKKNFKIGQTIWICLDTILMVEKINAKILDIHQETLYIHVEKWQREYWVQEDDCYADENDPFLELTIMRAKIANNINEPTEVEKKWDEIRHAFPPLDFDIQNISYSHEIAATPATEELQEKKK
jgi:hypothetical protein